MVTLQELFEKRPELRGYVYPPDVATLRFWYWPNDGKMGYSAGYNSPIPTDSELDYIEVSLREFEEARHAGILEIINTWDV